MKPESVLIRADLPLPLFCRGKVRDTYDLGDLLLIIATDRISAFDFVLDGGIPDKGLVLNQLSAFWFNQTKRLMPNHLIQSIDDISQLDTYVPAAKRFSYPAYLSGRSMIVKKVKRIPVECVVRGYLAGSAWEEYQQYGTACGIPLPGGLQMSQELPEVLFTPTTKADTGHDEVLKRDELNSLVGESLAVRLEKKSREIYNYACKCALTRGIIIADTKMEFGLDGNRLILIDELLTPDSSRFWDIKHYQVGHVQPSYDKQPLRDWLIESGWDKESPPPSLPPEVIEATANRYRKAYRQLTGLELKR